MIYTVTSLFAGVGGIDEGFEKTKHFKTVYANEFDKYAKKTFETNLDLIVDDNDITQLSEKKLEHTDVLLAGFPCQPFSVAGYRKGFEDNRGNLFFDTLRMIKKVKPQVIFLENVKNLVSHDGGNTFRVIKESLEANGYHIKYQVLNAKDFGNIPQNRERIYVVGFRNKNYVNKFEFPSSIPLKKTVYDVIDFDSKMDDRYYYTKDNCSFYDELIDVITEEGVIYQWRRRYVRKNKSGVVPTLTANMGTGGHNVPLIYTKHGIRKLTPRECFAVQGFPNDFELPLESSNTQLYKQAGNSVVVPVIERIANNIFKALS